QPAKEGESPERDDSRDEQAPPLAGFGHADLSPASRTRRPSAALWWYCSDTIRLFIGRSGRSVVARISGSQSTACSQRGGAYLNSTTSSAPTTTNPASRMM